MTKLSPAAQAAIDAWWNASDGEYIDGVWTPNRSAQLAAALEAVADQVVPEEIEPPCGETEPWPQSYQLMSDAQWEKCQQLRSELLAIAAELRGTTTPNQEGYSSHA